MKNGFAQILAAVVAASLALTQVVFAMDGAESDCRRGRGLKCWFVIAEINRAPERIEYIARHISPLTSEGVRDIEVIQVAEAKAWPDPYVVWTMQIDCKRR